MGDLDTPIDQNDAPSPKAAIEALPSEITEGDKRRIAKVAFATLENEMLNARTSKDKIAAANSTLDRFGYPAKGQQTIVTVPVPPEYLASMAKSLSNALKGDKSDVIDVVPTPESSGISNDRPRIKGNS